MPRPGYRPILATTIKARHSVRAAVRRRLSAQIAKTAMPTRLLGITDNAAFGASPSTARERPVLQYR